LPDAGEWAGLVQNVLDAQFAVFQINDRNRALAAQPPLPPTAPPNATVASGEVENQGFEIELTGRLLPGWDLTAGYAYVDTEFVRGTATQTGNAFDSATPRNNFNLWTRYQFDEGAMQGFHVGGGVKAVSEFYTGSGAVRFEEDGYEVFSAQVGYRFSPKLDVSLTADNLFDEKYYEKVSGAGRQNFYGAPRSYLVSLRGTF